MADGSSMAEGGSVLDFMSMKNYPDMSLDISMLNSLGKDFSVTISVLPQIHCQHLFEGAKCVYNVCVNLPRFFSFFKIIPVILPSVIIARVFSTQVKLWKRSQETRRVSSTLTMPTSCCRSSRRPKWTEWAPDPHLTCRPSPTPRREISTT